MRVVFALAFIVLAANQPAPGQIQFKHHFNDDAGPIGDAWGTNVIADFDNDGRLDVVVSKSKHGKGSRAAYIYRNLGSIDRWGDAQLLRGGLSTGCAAVALDVDRDGWMDLVAGPWLRNPGKKPFAEPFALGGWSLGEQIHDIELGDFDGDGHSEIVVNIQLDEAPGLYLFKAGADPAKPWKKTRIVGIDLIGGKIKPRPRGLIHAAVSPRGIGDLDGDGDLDIAYLGLWAENVDGKGTKWQSHRNLDFYPRGGWGAAVRCWVADMDGDGHNDIVQAACDGKGRPIVWYCNEKHDGSSWTRHDIPFAGKPGDMHSLAVADFDLDGDLDIYIDEMEHLNVPAGREADIGMWCFENLNGKGTSWHQTQIVKGLGGHQAQAADIDNDGDIDIVTRPYTAANVVHDGRMHISILENLARNPNATKAGSQFDGDRE